MTKQKNIQIAIILLVLSDVAIVIWSLFNQQWLTALLFFTFFAIVSTTGVLRKNTNKQ